VEKGLCNEITSTFHYPLFVSMEVIACNFYFMNQKRQPRFSFSTFKKSYPCYDATIIMAQMANLMKYLYDK
jgi:hypothetical protein